MSLCCNSMDVCLIFRKRHSARTVCTFLKLKETNYLLFMCRDNQENKNSDGMLASLLQRMHRQIYAHGVLNETIIHFFFNNYKIP